MRGTKRSMKKLILISLVGVALAGCSGDEQAPVQGDNPAAVGGRDVPSDMVKTGGPPPNTLPPGQGRSGGGGGGADGATTR